MIDEYRLIEFTSREAYYYLQSKSKYRRSISVRQISALIRKVGCFKVVRKELMHGLADWGKRKLLVYSVRKGW